MVFGKLLQIDSFLMKHYHREKNLLFSYQKPGGEEVCAQALWLVAHALPVFEAAQPFSFSGHHLLGN